MLMLIPTGKADPANRMHRVRYPVPFHWNIKGFRLTHRNLLSEGARRSGAEKQEALAPNRSVMSHGLEAAGVVTILP